MNAAFDQIAGYASKAPLTRVTLRRDQGPGFLVQLFTRAGRQVREWGYGSALYSPRLKGRHPVKLLASPDDPAPGNATLGSAIFGGDMLHEGERRALGEDFWDHLHTASPEFRKYAHSFHWLQDLAQVGDQVKARDAGETILGWWLPYGENWDAEIWQAETLARRLINWLVHAPLILSAKDLIYRSSVLNSMARQTRHLMRTHGDADAGLPQVYTGVALMLAGLLLPGGDAWLARGTKALERTLTAFILPDGGPASRNTSDAIRTMQLLILVRGAAIDTNKVPPNWLQTTLDRIAPFVRAMRHADGSFAQFAGVSAEGGHGTDAILAASEARGKAIENAAHTGFQRIAAGTSLLIADAGTPPAPALSGRSHAGTGSFEFSVGQERMIVNVGPASRRGTIPDLDRLSRTTAAHSALVIGDRNSTRILDDGRLGPGVAETLTIREVSDEGVHLKVLHDGYLKRFGVKHERSFFMESDGKRLRGSDKVFGPKLKKLGDREIILRFHLHPDISALKAPDGRITLETKSGKTWIFDVDGGDAEIEDSLYLSRPDHPRPTRQIVVRVDREGTNAPICNWVLSEMSL
ncbi:heparinase II/III family protein [Kordiimonas marina]|uniref:heparinase II/III family protein n=1 Tax=Kordiimonas marina TaxID=2872312 RepID=UPI001FF6CE20|nr:heparinase II/III family protein [Kordiimonas marina]MCJ9429797.1 heparinase II/III family protein [Kordiimonas marina]